MAEDELSPDERAHVERIEAMLASPLVWNVPPDDLEDRVVAAVVSAANPATRRRRVPWRSVTVAAAAAAALIVAVSQYPRASHVEAYMIALDPTVLAPTAHGEATLVRMPSGWRVTLSAKELPRRSGGRYYEAWLGSSDGSAVPVGTFNDGRSVTLWAGVSPDRFPVFIVTEEEADGRQDSSGRVVLKGTARRRTDSSAGP